MTRPKTVRAPTTASLPNDLQIPSTAPSLVKTLGRLSRQSLLDLAIEWLEDKNVQSFRIFLQQDEEDGREDEETNPYPASETIEEVREIYQELQSRKGGKREVIDRILEGDWRRGITLRQLAMADIRYVEDHPASHRWTALKLTRVGNKHSLTRPETPSKDPSACLPRFHASTFLRNLQHEISPLVKAHYHLSRSKSLPLTFLRIFVTDSPYQYPRQPSETFTDTSRVIYVAFPDSCPFIYTSIAAPTGTKAPAGSAAHSLTTDTRTLRHIVRDALPKALSRPQERYTLEATSLTAKSLHALLTLRGAGRTNAANGAFSIFADAVVEGSPLDPRLSNTVSPDEYQSGGTSERDDEGKENRTPTAETEQQRQAKKLNVPLDSGPDPQASKRRRLAIHSRFGTSGAPSSAPLDRLDIRLLDPPVADKDQNVSDGAADGADAPSTPPTMTLTFHGTDVISGLRKLTELGVVDPERMPSWMTGEEAVSVAVVKRGRRIVTDGGQ